MAPKLASQTRTTVVAALKRRSSFHALRLLRHYLNETGWTVSMTAGRSVDRDSNPTPWITYSARSFLEHRLPREIRVFEYGAGGSTEWWAQRASEVVSVEHDAVWYERLASLLPSNTTLIHRDVADGYAAEIGNHPPFDVVMIDGRDRVASGRYAVDRLTDRGIIVWDDSSRARYQEGLNFLRQRGFSAIDFYGMRPLAYSSNVTTVLYRPESNLLDL